MKVLISHAVEDFEAATAVKELIRRSSLNRIEVWFSSDRSSQGGMPIGGAWFGELHVALKATDWIVALITPRSISNPWLYYECGVGAATRSHSVVPLALGLPISSVPMPMAAYQVYDSLNAASLSTFLQKLLEADGFLFDEEMTKPLRERTQRQLIDFNSRVPASEDDDSERQTRGDNVAGLKSFIEKRFIELYKLLPSGIRPPLNLELEFDASELMDSNSRFTLNIPAGASFGDVLDEVYLRISDQVEPFTYLIQWMLTDTKEKSDLSIDAIKTQVPAEVLLRSGRRYKIKKLTKVDEYLSIALRPGRSGSGQ